MSETQLITSDIEPRFYSLMPHIADDLLTMEEYRLYGHFKRRVSHDGDGETKSKNERECYESTRATAWHCGMSEAAVRDARKGLKEKGFITIREVEGGTLHISLTNIWELSSEWFAEDNKDNRTLDGIYLQRYGITFEAWVGKRRAKTVKATEAPRKDKTPDVDVTPDVNVSTPPDVDVRPPLTLTSDKEVTIEEVTNEESLLGKNPPKENDNPSSFSTTKKGSSKKTKTTHTGAPTAQQRYWGIAIAVTEVTEANPTDEQIRTRLALAKSLEKQLGSETSGDEIRKLYEWLRQSGKASDDAYLPRRAESLAPAIADFRKHESEQEDYLYDIYMNARQEQARQER